MKKFLKITIILFMLLIIFMIGINTVYADAIFPEDGLYSFSENEVNYTETQEENLSNDLDEEYLNDDYYYQGTQTGTLTSSSQNNSIFTNIILAVIVVFIAGICIYLITKKSNKNSN